MPGSDILLTVAQVSVAFAGFASIVVLFQHREPGSWPRSVVVRIRTMVEGSLLTLFASLLPFLVYHLGASARSLWSISSGALFIAVVLFGVRVWRWSRGPLAARELKWGFAVVILLTTAIATVALLLNALALLYQPNFGVYLIAVLWTLCFTSFMFLRVITYPGEQ